MSMNQDSGVAMLQILKNVFTESQKMQKSEVQDKATGVQSSGFERGLSSTGRQAR